MIVFISGPMTGRENWNRTAFICAEARLSELGHTVLNPANHIPICHPDAIPHSGYIAICKAMIDQCEAIVQLPGWEDSIGAGMERLYAIKCGKAVLDYDEMIKEGI